MRRTETLLSIVEYYKLAPIIGSPTAGTTGNFISVTLPGGCRMGMTAMRVIKQDGSPHHGRGVLPTIPMSQTIKGVAEGRDEILERGIEEVTGGRATSQPLVLDGGKQTYLSPAAPSPREMR